MQGSVDRYNFLFRSTKGLVLVAIALIGLATAFFGMLSGPMAELGIRDAWVRLFNRSLNPIEREGRIVMLYHTIAMAVVAIETYIITAIIPMKQPQRANINATITVGYIAAMLGGLVFAYFGHNWIFHGIFIAGQALIFFAGVLLAIALSPWNKEYRARPGSAMGPGGMDLERAAFFTMAVATLGSALFGAVPASFSGNGFETFLAEDVVREVHKDALQLSVIGHLHIMLTLIAVALALIVGRWLDFKGRLHRWAMPLMIAGTIVITLGVWLVVPFEEIAHYVIYVGSVFILLAALFLVIFGFDKLMRERLEQKIAQANIAQKIGALLHDPLKFGALWQMVYMNFVVTFIGLFMAIRLDKVIRVWPQREERITLTGHWHILAGIIATIILFYYADTLGLKGKARQLFGWFVIVASDVAFGAAAFFATKRLYVSESAQQPLVDAVMLMVDAGLATVLVALAILMVWRLLDLFRKDGWWKKELGEEVPQ
jgi:MFS family permease